MSTRMTSTDQLANIAQRKLASDPHDGAAIITLALLHIVEKLDDIRASLDTLPTTGGSHEPG